MSEQPPTSEPIEWEPAATWPVEEAAVVPATVPADDGSHGGLSFGRWIGWLGLTVAFLVFVAITKISTHLGVEAPSYDKRGQEYVWRVWWRARHQVLDLGPTWGFPLLIATLTTLFVLGCLLAVWVAMVPNERTAIVELPDPDATSAQ